LDDLWVGLVKKSSQEKISIINWDEDTEVPLNETLKPLG
jgi:hypothetical protein